MKPLPTLYLALGLSILLIVGGSLILYQVDPKIMVGVILVSTGILLLIGIELGMLKDILKRFLYAFGQTLPKPQRPASPMPTPENSSAKKVPPDASDVPLHSTKE